MYDVADEESGLDKNISAYVRDHSRELTHRRLEVLGCFGEAKRLCRDSLASAQCDETCLVVSQQNVKAGFRTDGVMKECNARVTGAMRASFVRDAGRHWTRGTIVCKREIDR